jgi:hypothetical protein
VATTFELAVEKVVANQEDPKAYPLPRDAKAPENRLRGLIAKLPAAKRRELAAQVMPRVKAAAGDRARRLGDLAKIDLRAKQSVVEQLKALPLPENVKFLPADVTAIDGEIRRFRGTLKPIFPQQPAPELTQLLARVLHLHCTKTARARKDKISLAGIAVDNLGNGQDFGPIDMGEFEDDTDRDFALQVASIDTTQGNEFPKEFTVMYVLTENRAQTIGAILLVLVVIASIAAIVAALVATFITGGVAGLIALLISLGIDAITLSLAGALTVLALRDNFDQQSVSQLLEGLGRALADNGDVDPDTLRTLKFEFQGGKYEMDVNFALVAP